MRGSTRTHPARVGAWGVYPAHAGIDLFTGMAPERRSSLPRACGDRPDKLHSRPCVEQSTPRMRGSTPAGTQRISLALVYPAHAGIDPMSHAVGDTWNRLPRACGDRPSISPPTPPRNLSTPRMRGSTRHRDGSACRRRVYPAHAGIDPLPAR